MKVSDLKMSEIFDIHIYTAGDQNYADQIIDKFDHLRVIKNRFYKRHCKFTIGQKSLSRSPSNSVDNESDVLFDNQSNSSAKVKKIVRIEKDLNLILGDRLRNVLMVENALECVK